MRCRFVFPRLIIALFIIFWLFRVIRMLTEILEVRQEYASSTNIFDIGVKGYKPNAPIDHFMYKLLLKPNYFSDELRQNGIFTYSAVDCRLAITIHGQHSVHSMCQVPVYGHLQVSKKDLPFSKVRRKVFLIGRQRDRLFEHNFLLQTSAYFNITSLVNSKGLAEMEEKFSLKNIMTDPGESYDFGGLVEMAKYEVQNSKDEDLVVTLVKPVEICIIFVSLFDYPIGHIPQFIWKMNAVQYHVITMNIKRKQKTAFVSFIRQGCMKKYLANGPYFANVKVDEL